MKKPTHGKNTARAQSRLRLAPRFFYKQLIRLKKLARSRGFEPLTAWFVARYSIQLSYERVKGVNTNNFLINCNPKSVFDLFFFKES